MTASLQLDVVSPARVIFSGATSLVEIPGTEGDFGVLPGHAPFFSMLRPGVVTIHAGGGKQRWFVASGYADVGPEGATILSDAIRDLATVSLADAVAELEAANTAWHAVEGEQDKIRVRAQQRVAEALVQALQ